MRCVFPPYDLSGKSRYFGFGYPSGAFQKVNWFLQIRFRRLLRTRSQRRGRQLEGPSRYQALRSQGLIYLQRPSRQLPAKALG